MMSLGKILMLIHLAGLVSGVGAATVKVALIIAACRDRTLIPAYVRVSKLITRFIVLGLVVLTLSGAGLMLLGTPFSLLLIVKLVFVAAVWAVGPIIDNVIEPRLTRFAPATGEEATPEFLVVQKKHLRVEVLALLLFYVAAVMGGMI